LIGNKQPAENAHAPHACVAGLEHRRTLRFAGF
jgi:hypothetical protein